MPNNEYCAVLRCFALPVEGMRDGVVSEAEAWACLSLSASEAGMRKTSGLQ